MERLRSCFLTMTLMQAAVLACGLWVQDQFLAAEVAKALAEGPDVAAETGQRIRLLRLVSWVWVGGLQAAVAYLVVSKTNSEHLRRLRRSEGESLQRERDLVRTRNAVVFGLAKLAESRDPETGQHLERIAVYSKRLATELRGHPRYGGEVTPAFLQLIGISSALHDIGKVGVADEVLLKPGRLTEDERFRMQLHASVGGECIREIELRLGTSNFLQMAREIAYCHHERWDGQGYPQGLAGEDIPLSARIVAVADVYDALTSRRVYKQAYSHEHCVRVIREEAGRQFYPQVVEAFLKVADEFREIGERYRDDAQPPPEPDEPRMTPAQEQTLLSVVGPRPAEELGQRVQSAN
jgi:response regulator RpfG family c-di-GMP phosphodiesterase